MHPSKNNSENVSNKYHFQTLERRFKSMMRCRQSDPAVKCLPSLLMMLPMTLLMPLFQQNLMKGSLKMGTAMQAAPSPTIP